MPQMDRPTVFLIGAQQALGPIRQELTRLVALEAFASWDRGLGAVEEEAARIVLVAASAEGAPAQFVKRLRGQVPHCRAATIAVDPGAGLTVQRWDTATLAFVSQQRPVADLVSVVCELLRPVVEVKVLRPLREVGFYNHLSLGARTLHLQTEVLGRDEIRIKSTVLEGGRIVYATMQPLPLDVTDLEQGTAFVREQHQAVLAQADKKRF